MSIEDITDTTQFLTFKLGDERFALDVAQVREVLDLTAITRVPRAPDFMRGVINVRGSVVPVVDMRMKFGMSKNENIHDTRVVVLDLDLDGDRTVIGAMADSVHDVMDLKPDQIDEPPRIGTRWKTEFLKGIGKHNDEFIIILDIDRIFSTNGLALAQETGNGNSAGEAEKLEVIAA